MRRLRWGFLGGVVVLLLGSCLAVLLRFRQGEDAAVRQQERVSGDRRHAERHHAGRDGARGAAAGRGDAEAAGSGQRPDLRGHGFAVQLQWPGASLLSAPRTQCRRHPGEPAAARASAICRATRSPSRCGSACCPSPSATARASRWPRCRPDRRCSQTLVAEVYGPAHRRAHRDSRGTSAIS